MMNQMYMWQMAVDLCLVTSILVFAFRWMKSSKAQAMLPRTLELEATLRALITEADAAGRHLNEQLLRREQNLQRYLADAEESEQRLTRTIALGEDRSKQIEISIQNCRDLIAELKESYLIEKEELRRHHRPAPSVEPEPRASSTTRGRQDAAQEMIPAIRADELLLDVAAPTSRAPRASQMETTAERGRAAARSSMRIEKEVVSAPTPSTPKSAYAEQNPRSTAEIQRVYAAAEVLIKQGQKLEQVVAQTRLPEEEVRMLSQMIEIERDEEERKARESSNTIATDPRLGALGSIRRQTTTL